MEQNTDQNGRDQFSQCLLCRSARKGPVASCQVAEAAGPRAASWGTSTLSWGQLSPLQGEQVLISKWDHSKTGNQSKEMGLCSSRMGNCQDELGAEAFGGDKKHFVQNSIQDCNGSWAERERENTETMEKAVWRNSSLPHWKYSGLYWALNGPFQGPSKRISVQVRSPVIRSLNWSFLRRDKRLPGSVVPVQQCSQGAHASSTTPFLLSWLTSTTSTA